MTTKVTPKNFWTPFTNQYSYATVSMDKMVQIIVGLTTGLNVSQKSHPGTCEHHLPTNIPFWRAIVPSRLCLILKSHLQPITFLPGGKGTKVQVWLRIKASYSSWTAIFHSLLAKVSSIVCGSHSWSSTVSTFNLKILTFDWVTKKLVLTSCRGRSTRETEIGAFDVREEVSGSLSKPTISLTSEKVGFGAYSRREVGEWTKWASFKGIMLVRVDWTRGIKVVTRSDAGDIVGALGEENKKWSLLNTTCREINTCPSITRHW